MSYDAVIFDSDGVLVEPTDPMVHRNAARKAFIEFGVLDPDTETIDHLIEITGDDRDKLSVTHVQRVCEEYGIDTETFWRRRELLAAEAQHEEIKHGRKTVYPDIGVVHLLDAPPLNLSLGVISNNQHRTLEHVLDSFHLEHHFDAIYGRQPTLKGIDRRKPNTHYAERLVRDLDAENPLFVGDSLVDIQTADRLGIDSIFLSRAHRSSYQLPDPPDYEVDSLEGVLDIVS